jgi:hypothetical protein
VLDQTLLGLPGVSIRVLRGDRVLHDTTTERDGTFEVPVTDPDDVIEAVLDGFETTRVPAGEAARIVMALARASEVTEVTASALTSTGAAMERLGSTMTAPLAQRLPAVRPRILQSLPLLPSVVRGRDGQLRIGGTRPHESSLWIDGFDVTDPVTLTSAIDLPIESVKGMAVLRDPIAATFSGVLGSLASIETVPGGDAFNGGVQGFIPRPRLSNMGLGKIEAFFPRAYAGGRVGKMHYFGSMELSFERVPVPGVTSSAGNPNIGTTGITSFVRADFQTSPRNAVTFEGMFVPSRQSNTTLSPLQEEAAAPDVRTRDLFGGFVDRFVFGPRDLLTIRVGVLEHRTELASEGDGDAIMTPGGWQQNWFATVDHRGTRQSLSITWDRTGLSALGAHAISLSGDLRRRAMRGTIAHETIRILDDSGRLARMVEFGPTANLAADDLVGGIGIRDVWNVTSRLQVDADLRIDRGAYTTLAPRVGVRYALDSDEWTVLKGSAGRFVGRVPLSGLAFDQFAARRDTTFDLVTGARPRTAVYETARTTLGFPHADGFAIDFERRLRPGLEVQVGVRQRVGSDLPTVDVPAAGGVARLSSSGTSTYREFQASVRQMWSDGSQAFLSYVRSASEGEVNDFGTLFTGLAAPLLEPGGTAPTPSDVPHRLRGWATFNLPWQFVFSPALEWRSGFPFSVQDLDRHYVGDPNSERFPSHFAVDVTVFKTFEFGRRKLDLGLQFFNATGHFNPRDVVAIAGSSRFGEFTNSFGVTLGGYLQVSWQ